MRYVAFPSAWSRESLDMNNVPSQHGNWTIVAGPTESGLYILEANEEAIELMRMLYGSYYLFMEDFCEPD